MSEPTEPAADAVDVEVEMSVEQQQVEEEQPSQTLEEEKQLDISTASTEIVEESEEIVQQIEEQDPLQVQPVQEQEVSQEREDQSQQNQQEIQEKEDPIKSLEESQDSMLIHTANEQAIEDETMPSLISSKIDESGISNIEQDNEKKCLKVEESSRIPSPKKEDNDSDDSVCVIDDDDDDDEEEVGEGSSYDDESSSYDDSGEEIDMNHYHYNKRNEKNVRRIDVDDEEDEDEDEDEEDEEDEDEEGDEDDEKDKEDEEDEEMEDDSDVDGFDGGSDDLVLRHSNGLTERHKERSASLQDLSVNKGRSPKNKRNVNPFSQKARYERNQAIEQRIPQVKQFSQVQSKVKKYINEIKEQNRMSTDKHKKVQEEGRRKNPLNEPEICRTEETVKTCKNTKEYTDKTFKDVSEFEKNDIYLSQGIENGEISIFPRRSMGNGATVQEVMDVEPIQIDLPKNDEKVDKINGAMTNENQNNYIPEKGGILRQEYVKPVLNGEDQSDFSCNLRTLTYDEYMKISGNKEAHEEVIDESEIEEVQEEIPEKCNNNDAEAACLFRIENVTSNYCNAEKVDNSSNNTKTHSATVHQSTETFYQESPEIYTLRHALDQRNSQFDSLRDAYQRTLTDNMAMKMEVENLKKMLSYYKEQQKFTPEMKTAAIQTEFTTSAPSMPIIEVDNMEQQNNPRLSASLNSGISSQWSDTTGSIAFSMEPPPNITNTLNSDESSNHANASKKKSAFNRAFVTSTRILQTLSSITHGKSKADKYADKYSKSVVPDIQADISTSTQNEENNPSNSRKRKAYIFDSVEDSDSTQPFKIPHLTKSCREKGKRSSKSPEPNFESTKNDANNHETASNEETTKIENQGNEFGEDVKVFQFEDDENGQNSFLIQAKEVDNNIKSGTVRECGPYLLGNVEVYMTEKDGTINIWGKDLNQNSSNKNEKLENSTSSKDLKADIRWQSTPRVFGNPVSATTGKKSRVVPRFTPQHPHQRHSCASINTMADHENCSSHRIPWSSCNHSCCPTRSEEPHCGRVHNERRSCEVHPCFKSQNYIDPRRFSLPDVHHNNSCCYSNHSSYKNTTQDESSRYHPFVRRHSFNPTDDEEESTTDNEEDDRSTHKNEAWVHSDSNNKITASSTSNRKSMGGNSDPSCENDNDPLIFPRPHTETQEIQKRRSGGKKVRGILMDLIKGCGDCRTPLNKTGLQNTASIYEPSTSAQKKACSLDQLSSTIANEKCTSYRKQTDKTAEFEAQLENFRIEMEKLRSREDNLREMLDTLRNKDTIN